MKKTVILCVLCCSAQLMQAIEKNQDNKEFIDPVYFQLYGGINKSANENLPWTEFSSYPWSYGAFLGIGKEVTPIWGWRAAFRYNHNKSRNVQECESPETWGWNSLGLFADATFDITDALASKSSQHSGKFNLKAFLGVGAAYTTGFDAVPLSYTEAYSRNSCIVPGVRLGLDASVRIASNWRVGLELSHTQFGDQFNGVKAGIPTDGRTNLKVGVTYLLGKKKKQMKETPVVYNNRLRVLPELPFIMPKAETQKHRMIMGRAFLDFPVNETVINPNYRRNPQELARICATIDSALFDKTIQVTHISLHGYASPESPYSNNTRLAKGRTASLMEFLRKRYHLSASLFQNEFTPEDWKNLRGFIADGNRRRVKGDIWYENASILETPETPDVILKYQGELLDVIDSNLDPDEKEDKLKQVGAGEPYRWLLRYIYPGLRHTDYVIEYNVRSYPVNESRRLIYTHPEALSVKEMYLVAQSYEEGSDDWLDALMIAAKQYPKNQTANLNAACACVKAKRLTDAKLFLQNAGNSSQAQYLADVISAMEGKCKWKMENGKLVIVDSEK